MLPQEIAIPVIPPAGSTRPVVIGVVADAIAARLHERSPFAVYEPLDPESAGLAHLVFRAAPSATGAVQQASQRMRAIDPQADIRIASIASRLQQEAGRPRMMATLTGAVGLIAILLCVIGLYGLTASVVGQRSREMGVRIALGAKPRDLLSLLLWDSLRPVLMGLVAGAGAALLAGRLVAAAMFFGVPPGDPIAFAGAAVILPAAAILAVLVPARRAAAVDAALVLRRY
jgi:ABC-type antimicrobial peptide transport system permease subunit